MSSRNKIPLYASNSKCNSICVQVALAKFYVVIKRRLSRSRNDFTPEMVKD